MIKNKINEKDIKKILNNSENKILFIKRIFGNDVKSIFGSKPSRVLLDKWIMDNWNYVKARKIIREMFKETKKYENAKLANNEIPILINEFKKIIGEAPNWPCNQSSFDLHAQRINNNSSYFTRKTKDAKIAKDAIKFRRMKEIKTYINDFLEKEIFSHSENIIPTLAHSSKGDFYINGILFDQKTTHISEKFLKENLNITFGSKDFILKYGKWLYINQGEDRFSAGKKIYVIYKKSELENLTPNDIKLSIINSNFDNDKYTFNISYEYGKGSRTMTHCSKFKMICLKKI